MIDSSRPIYRTKDLAEVLGVSQEYIRRQVHDGHLHASTKRLSHHRHVLRFSLNDVMSYDSDAAQRLLKRTHVPRGTTPL